MRRFKVPFIFFLFFSFLTAFLIFKYIEFSNIPTLSDVVTNALNGSNGTYAVAVKNLKTNESYYFNEKKEFDSASLYKIWVLAETKRQVNNGQIKEDEVLSEDIVSLNKKFDIASDSAELTEGTATLSVRDAMRQMITISHNYAALLLTEKVGLSKVSAFAKQNGFEDTSFDGAPKTTAFDVALFFEKIYKGEIVDKKSSSEMLTLFKNQKLNDKLPKYLPQGIDLAHKTGEISSFSHDGGIVFGKKSDYVIVILSRTDYPPLAEERIAKISKSVFDYFENK